MCGAWRDGAAAHGVMFDDEPSGSRGAFGAVGTGRSTGVRPWQDIAAVRSQALADGKMLAKCVSQRSTAARFRSDAFPGCRLWQDVAVVRSRAAIRGKISPWRVPGQSTVAVFSPHAFPKEPRAGKAPARGNISPPCIRNELVLARYARHASEKPCKQPSGNTLREDLAAKAPFSRPRPSNHARRADLAMPRRRHTRPAQKRSSEAVGASTPSRLPCL